MFTNNIANLRDFCDDETLSLVRDGAFKFPCKISNKLRMKLVACQTKDHVDLANDDPDVTVLITLPELADFTLRNKGLGVSSNPQAKVFQIFEELGHNNFFWNDFPTQIDPTATISPSAIISPKNVIIGPATNILAGAIVCPRVIIESHCNIGEGTVIGSDAFEVNKHIKPRRILKQQGGVRIGDNVEVQAKCTIVRATFGGFTNVSKNVKVDCQVHIAHDCSIGENTIIAACAEISGRVEIGENCFLGPNCTITNGVTIGSNAQISLGAVVTQKVTPNQKVSGNFAIEHDTLIKYLKNLNAQSTNDVKNA